MYTTDRKLIVKDVSTSWCVHQLLSFFIILASLLEMSIETTMPRCITGMVVARKSSCYIIYYKTCIWLKWRDHLNCCQRKEWGWRDKIEPRSTNINSSWYMCDWICEKVPFPYWQTKCCNNWPRLVILCVKI